MRRDAAARALVAPLALAAIGLAFALPLWWMFVAATRPMGAPPPTSVEWLPHGGGIANLAELFRLVPTGRYLVNSLLLELVAVPVTLLVASWAAFAMRFAPTRARHALVVLTILTMLVPGAAVGLTRFLVFKHLHLIDHLAALAAPSLAATNSFFVLLFYRAFRRLPDELFEAARLEGAGWISQWAHIAMPLSRPAIVAVSILAFSYYWSDLTAPLLVLKSEDHYTLPVGIEMLREMHSIHGPVLMAGCVVMVLPVLVLFLALQKTLGFEGRVLGSVIGKQKDPQ